MISRAGSNALLRLAHDHERFDQLLHRGDAYRLRDRGRVHGGAGRMLELPRDRVHHVGGDDHRVAVEVVVDQGVRVAVDERRRHPVDVDRVHRKPVGLLEDRVAEGRAEALRVCRADQLLGDVALEHAPAERRREIVEGRAESVLDERVENDPVVALLRDHRHRLHAARHLLDVVVPARIAVGVELGEVADVAESGPNRRLGRQQRRGRRTP